MRSQLSDCPTISRQHLEHYTVIVALTSHFVKPLKWKWFCFGGRGYTLVNNYIYICILDHQCIDISKLWPGLEKSAVPLSGIIVDFHSGQLTFHSRLPDGWQVVYQLNHEKSKLDLAEEFTFVLSLGCVMVK